ncbi:hypothetical protein Bca101_068099 [Brassica carinata]
MTDLSVQTRVASSEGYNVEVVYGSCGFFDVFTSRLLLLRLALTRVPFVKAEAFAKDCLFALIAYSSSIDTGVGAYGLGFVSSAFEGRTWRVGS